MTPLSVFRPSAWVRLGEPQARALWRRAAPRLFDARYICDGVITQFDLHLAVGSEPDRLSYRHYLAKQLSARAALLDGAFVTIGVAQGMAPLRILQTVAPRNAFWLVDSWDGRRSGADASAKDGYTSDLEAVQKRFEPYPNVRFLRGLVPDVLADLAAPSIAFAHFNLGDPASEIEALRLIGGRLQRGGAILIDGFARDLTTPAQRAQYLAAAASHNLYPIILATGQAVILG